MDFRAQRRRGGAAGVLALLATALALFASGCGASGGDPPTGQAGRERAVPALPARGGLVVGLNSVWNNPSSLRRVAAAGVRMERLEIAWPSVEPARGHWTWGSFDEQFAVTARHGVTILPLLMAIPPWQGGAGYAITAGGPGFSAYVGRVVRRYGPGGTFWRRHPRLPYHPATWFEIWNEPYLSQFSSDGPQPEAYARLFKAAVQAGRRASRAARFLLAADTTGVTAGGDLPAWVGPMYRAVPDLNRYVDGIAIHPYSSPRGPLYYTPGVNTRFEFRRIEHLRRLFVAHHAGAKPVWITEIGWPTCPDNESCVSESDQATYLSQLFTLLRTRYSSWVHALFVYNYHDPPQSTDPTDKERWFGLIRRDGSSKPAWNVVRAASR